MKKVLLIGFIILSSIVCAFGFSANGDYLSSTFEYSDLCDHYEFISFENKFTVDFNRTAVINDKKPINKETFVKQFFHPPRKTL